MPRYSRKVVEKRRGEAITKRFAFQANAITNTTEKLITTKIQVSSVNIKHLLHTTSHV